MNANQTGSGPVQALPRTMRARLRTSAAPPIGRRGGAARRLTLPGAR
jgi:hypothetical protein